VGLYFILVICFHIRIGNHSSETDAFSPLVRGKQSKSQNEHTRTNTNSAIAGIHNNVHADALPAFEDPTDPKNAVHRSLDEFITVGGVIYRPGVHYNCTKQDGTVITLPRLPTFLVVGVQKGGTSALNALLSKHRRIMKPVYFEPHFFDQHPAIIDKATLQQIHSLAGKETLGVSNDTTVSSDVQSYQTPPLICDLREIYADSCFLKKKVLHYPAMLTYEKTPAYILTDGAPETIKTIAPWTKIIISLRNPVDR
jgi:hypothetical protein